ncbi:hypothetical protein CYLTODRAFT_414601 [Cylindrobasidium torrendii FP15055 ss-10]|uniref:RRM domain-containing protein n=1 Tax=Cylindrobasidium torrendii FP15055 ss-10 TaxID=1314674 RepID=A0A0D7AX97_9AGAR|nr:hypothetical protein CYLTODRAFT_414601 [Cylindrobasidium torrendii FP15055 ss-10]
MWRLLAHMIETLQKVLPNTDDVAGRGGQSVGGQHYLGIRMGGMASSPFLDRASALPKQISANLSSRDPPMDHRRTSRPSRRLRPDTVSGIAAEVHSNFLLHFPTTQRSSKCHLRREREIRRLGFQPSRQPCQSLPGSPRSPVPHLSPCSNDSIIHTHSQTVDVLSASSTTIQSPTPITYLPILESIPSSALAPKRHYDEDFINRSLLDSLDAQADAEPTTSSDSEHATGSYSSTSASSQDGSPSVPYHMVMHPQGAMLPPTDMVHDHDPHHILHRMHSQDALYPSMYPTDPVLDADLHKRQPPSAFKSSAFSSFQASRQQRHQPFPTNPPAFRDFPLNEMYQAPLTSPGHGFDARQSFDFAGQSMVNGVGPAKPSFNDHGMLPPHKMQQHGAPSGSQLNGYNGSGFNPSQLSSQTPFGPHLPSAAQHANGTAPPMMSAAIPPGPTGQQPPQQEEISTIFVVGFPDDMQATLQEREFQNMFTFSPGFEAATLKIPNKEYTSYGSAAARAGNPAYNNGNDAYHLVNGNDNRDLWATPSADENGPSFGPGGPMNATPRKQIIGFAKFRTREEALGARDQLQGRRVDIEKGAILKAEMAKKNLHTKRGVGPISGSMLNPNGAPAGPMSGSTSLPNMGVPNGTLPDAYGADPREREYGTIRVPFQQVDRGTRSVRDDDERKDAALAAMGFAMHRGPREREEEERERRRLEREVTRMRSTNTTAYDAFYSVPEGISRQASNMLLADDSGTPGIPANAYQLGMPGVPTQAAEEVGPWDGLPRNSVPSAIPIGTRRGTSQRSSSPSNNSPPNTAAVGGPRSVSPPAEMSDSKSRSSSIAGSSDIGSRGSATDDDVSRVMAGLAVSTNNGTTSPQLSSPSSGASSGSSGTRNGIDQNPPVRYLARKKFASQLTSNAQINTLYVGNLPIQPLPLGFGPETLEEQLRELFQLQPGYRRLSFKQKNGPMCFVEFEDVHFATKAMNDLYGHTLNGLVKSGGIRLSYSKNPLGVRTPTSATASGPQMQQQQAGPFSIGPSAYGLVDERLSYVPRELSPPPLGSYGSSPPPPRFSTSPSAIHFAASSGTNASLPRGSPYAYNPLASPTASSSFTPFALHTSIPEQSLAEHSHHYISRDLSPNPSNIEPARAG